MKMCFKFSYKKELRKNKICASTVFQFSIRTDVSNDDE